MDIIKIKNENGQWITVPAFQGQIGKTPNFSIGVVEAGTTPSSAAASITGTAEYPILNLTLPKGVAGDVGIAVQDTEPNSQLAWIDTSSTGNTVTIPEVKDNVINTTDTWSSAKIRDFIYPIGSIYISVNNVSPAAIFGGTWEQIQDTFLLAAGSNYTAGDTGGEAEHTLIENEMPSHTHIQDAHCHWVTSRMNSDGTDGGSGFQISNRTGGSGNANYYLNAGGTNNGGYSSGNSVGALNKIAVNQNSGGGQAHNNMPPYLVVYMWKRVS